MSELAPTDVYRDKDLGLKGPVIGEMICNATNNLLCGPSPAFFSLSNVFRRKETASSVNHAERDVLLWVGECYHRFVLAVLGTSRGGEGLLPNSYFHFQFLHFLNKLNILVGCRPSELY